MIKTIDNITWFCCPKCGKKIHPVKPGAFGVYAMCKGRLPNGCKCDWQGEITYKT